MDIKTKRVYQVRAGPPLVGPLHDSVEAAQAWIASEDGKATLSRHGVKGLFVGIVSYEVQQAL